MPSLLALLNSPKESHRKETCWTLSNITAGNKQQIQVFRLFPLACFGHVLYFINFYWFTLALFVYLRVFLIDLESSIFMCFWVLFLNPLAANVLHVRHLEGPACRRRSAFHRQNPEKCPWIFRKTIAFATKWYTKLSKYPIKESIASNLISNLEFTPAKKEIFEKGPGS